MKRWIADSVQAHIVPGDAVMLAHTSNCIGRRFNKMKGFSVRVYSRDATPLADAILAFHVERHGA